MYVCMYVLVCVQTKTFALLHTLVIPFCAWVFIIANVIIVVFVFRLSKHYITKLRTLTSNAR